MKIVGEKVTAISKSNEFVSFPATIKCIGEWACSNGRIETLYLEETNIVIIEKYAFTQCFYIKEITFPSSLEKIDQYAFNCCKQIKHIKFPSGSKLKKIGPCAFRCCYDLETFEFPPLLEVMGENVFEYHKIVIDFDLRETKVKKIGYSAFGDNNKVNVFFPPTVSPVSVLINSHYQIKVDENHPTVREDKCGYYASKSMIFKGNKKKKHVLIRCGVEEIATACFSSSNLASILIPASVILISRQAFSSCERLKRIRFDKNSRLREIKSEAFYGCVLIKKINFPASLELLDDFSFGKCDNLIKVTFPPGSKLQKIKAAFPYSHIKHLNLPPSTRVIDDVTYKMNDLESIFIDNDLYKSNKEENAVFSKDGSELVCIIKNLSEFQIPDGVRVIKRFVFYESTICGKLIIPASVEIIENEAFRSCSNLDVIEFVEGSKLNHIRYNALPKLKDLIINNENFVKMDNGVVMSRNPCEIVFTPKDAG